MRRRTLLQAAATAVLLPVAAPVLRSWAVVLPPTVPNGFTSSVGAGMTTVLPKSWRGDGTVTGVVYCHGSGQDSRAVVGFDLAGNGPAVNQQHLVQQVALAGFPVLSIDAAGNAWGNDNAIAAVAAARAHLQTTLGAKPGKVLLVGVSMGGLTCLNWARQHRDQCAGFAGIMPVSDLQNYYANSGNAAGVDAAYGGRYDDNVAGLTHNPTRYTADILALPYRAWYGSADTIVPPITVTNLARAIYGQTTELPGQVHGETLIGAVDPTELIAFLRANA